VGLYAGVAFSRYSERESGTGVSHDRPAAFAMNPNHSGPVPFLKKHAVSPALQNVARISQLLARERRRSGRKSRAW